MNESNHTTYTLRICHRCMLPSGPCTLTGCSIHICLVLRSDFGLEKTDRETALDDCSRPQSTADPKTIPQQSLPILNPLRGSSHLFIFLQTLKSSLGFGILLEFAFHYVPLDQTGIKQKHFERKCASSPPSKGILKRMACDGPKLWEPETSRNPTLNYLSHKLVYTRSTSIWSVFLYVPWRYKTLHCLSLPHSLRSINESLAEVHTKHLSQVSLQRVPQIKVTPQSNM